MRQALAITLALALTFCVAAAWAGEVQGKIQKVDTTDRVIVLEDGTQVWLAEGISLDALKEGAVVKAMYEERDGKKVATTIEVSQ